MTQVSHNVQVRKVECPANAWFYLYLDCLKSLRILVIKEWIDAENKNAFEMFIHADPCWMR